MAKFSDAPSTAGSSPVILAARSPGVDVSGLLRSSADMPEDGCSSSASRERFILSEGQVTGKVDYLQIRHPNFPHVALLC